MLRGRSGRAQERKCASKRSTPNYNNVQGAAEASGATEFYSTAWDAKSRNAKQMNSECASACSTFFDLPGGF